MTCSTQTTSPRRSAVLPTTAAVLLASLLGIGLAYGACAMLIPAMAHQRADVSLLSADDRTQDVICSVSDPSTSARADR